MKERHKLDSRDTCTLRNPPQVRGNCDHALNREENLSEFGLKTKLPPHLRKFNIIRRS
jgi:hypothetical protein